MINDKLGSLFTNEKKMKKNPEKMEPRKNGSLNDSVQVLPSKRFPLLGLNI